MLGEATIFSEIVCNITEDDLTLLNYIVTIKRLAKEGQARLSEEENKPRSKTHWTPKPRSALLRQLKEAGDKNAPESSIWRKFYILGGLKVVLILGLVANGRNPGNRNSKSKMKRSIEETVDAAVEKAAENAENRREEKPNSKLTLEETIKLWPLQVLKGLVEEILKITLPQKVGLWHIAQPDDSGDPESGDPDSGEVNNGELDSGEVNSGEPDISQGLSKKRKRGDDDQLTGVMNFTRRLLRIVNFNKRGNIQPSQTTQMRSVSVPSLLNREGTLKNAKFTVGNFRKIIPKWNNHTTLYVNPLSLEPAGPRRIDILGNDKAQVNVTGYGEQPKDLKEMSPSRFYESIMSHLDDEIGLNMACCNGSGVMQILIPGSLYILTLQMQSATKLWQLLSEKD